MTGLFPTAHGSMDNFSWLDEDAVKWTTAASASGYRTAGIGKMHFSPWDIKEGFNDRVICEDKRHFYIPDDHARFMKSHGKERPHPKDVPGYFETCGAPDFPFDKELYPDVFIADQGVKWLNKNGDEPFALWVSFIGPHDPYDPPEEYSQMYADAPIPEPIPGPEDSTTAPSFEDQKKTQPGVGNSTFRLNYDEATPEQIIEWRKKYFGNITLIDEGIGRILKVLEEKGIIDDTVIIFTSDHGDALGDHGMIFKSFFYESMVHVPLIVRDGENKGRRSALVGTTDIVAYFHDVLQIDLPESIQGKSIAPILKDKTVEINRYVFSEMPSRMMVYDGRFKYVHEKNGRHEFYDHGQDPEEMNNLIDDLSMKPKIDELRVALINHQIESAEIHGRTRHKVAYQPRLQMEADYREQLSKG
jgi:arylsulfatase